MSSPRLGRDRAIGWPWPSGMPARQVLTSLPFILNLTIHALTCALLRHHWNEIQPGSGVHGLWKCVRCGRNWPDGWLP